jgi:hypothetical protein
VTATSRRAAAELVSSYLEAIERIDYVELKTLQRRPHADLAHGAAGTAYALWRLGHTRRARTWLEAALRDHGATAIAPATRASFLHGRAGLHWLRALVAPTERHLAVDAYARCARTATRSTFIEGAAGHLTGARILLAQFEDRRLRRLATSLAARLWERLERRARRAWRASDTRSFAHGWPGIVHAAVAWNRWSGEPISGQQIDVVRRFAAAWSPPPAGSLRGAWCNGAAGAAVVFASAYAAVGDEALLRTAERAASVARSARWPDATLCCGLGGAAYAMLAIDRVAPDRGWRERADAMALRAMQPSAMPWPNGLYRGYPGLICLARDTIVETPLGIPAIDA